MNGMSTLEMISQPLMFVEHLREYTGKVCQTTELIPALMAALLTADDARAGHLHRQISEIETDVEHLKHALYDQFKDVRFRESGEYALGQYIAGLDRAAGAVQEFADVVVARKVSIPSELHADLQALADQTGRMAEQILRLAQMLWPPEEAVPPAWQADDMLAVIAGIADGRRQARELEMACARRLDDLSSRLDPAALLYLSRCLTPLKVVANELDVAADHLRMVIG